MKERIDQIVAAEIQGECVVVGHSLGSVVSHQILTSIPAGQANVSLFMTLGSPLGLSAIRPHLKRRPLLKVGRWVNACDPRDVVALVERLERPHFFDQIENITDVANPLGNAHGIGGYLRDAKVCRSLSQAFK